VRRPVPLLLVALYASEAGTLGFLLGCHKLADRPWWTPSNAVSAGTAGALLLAIAGLVAAVLSIARARRTRGRGSIRLTIALNAFTVGLALLLAESSLRIVATPDARGVTVLGRALLPYSWDSIREHQRRRIARAGNAGAWERTYLVPDADLGWTVGPDRANPERKSYSSAEGIRSPRPGVRYAGLAQGKRIVALVGDSYTFGLDVSFEESWAGRLQELLGDEFLVLNFGVEGFGIDQAYLRYGRDVARWQPDVVVFGVIQHDFWRTLAVYPWIAFPSWEIPFSKPRFELANGEPVVRNVPVAPPSEVFAHASIEDLPALELETAYDPLAWRWTPLAHSYAARVLLTFFHPHPPDRVAGQESDFRGINLALLRLFRDRCAAAGSRPLVVYLPSNGAGDFPETTTGRRDEGWALRALRSDGHPFLDVSAAIRALPADRRFLPEGHYTPAANEAAARGIGAAVREALQR